jgi:hypothetical protein
VALGFDFTPPAVGPRRQAVFQHAAQRTARRIISPPARCRCTKESALSSGSYEPLRAVAAGSKYAQILSWEECWGCEANGKARQPTLPNMAALDMP